MPRITDVKTLSLLSDQLAAQRNDDSFLVTVCGGPGCQATRCHDVAAKVKEVLDS